MKEQQQNKENILFSAKIIKNKTVKENWIEESLEAFNARIWL